MKRGESGTTRSLRSDSTVELQASATWERLGRHPGKQSELEIPMSLDEKVNNALKHLISTGLVHEVHTQQHVQYVEGGPVPDGVNVSAVLYAPEPDEHRTEIERLLRSAGFGEVVVRLHRIAARPNPLSEQAGEQRPDDISTTDEGATRERANRLWEAEGKPEGRQEEYWHRAQELIDDESQSSYRPSQSRGNRT